MLTCAEIVLLKNHRIAGFRDRAFDCNPLGRLVEAGLPRLFECPQSPDRRYLGCRGFHSRGAPFSILALLVADGRLITLPMPGSSHLRHLVVDRHRRRDEEE